MKSLLTWLRTTYHIAGQSPRALALLMAATWLQAGLDMASTTALIPLLLALWAPQELAILSGLSSWLQKYSISALELKWGILIFVVLFFLLKYVIVNIIIKHRARAAYKIAGRLSETLLHAFLQQPYTRYTEQKSSGQLVKIIHLPNSFANNIFLPTLSIAAEGMVLLLLCTLFVLLQPFLSISILVATIPFMFWFLASRKKLDAISATQKKKYPELISSVLAMFDAFVEINLYQLQKPFIDEFKKTNHDLNQTQVELHALHHRSGRLLEAIVGIVLCVVLALAMANTFKVHLVAIATAYVVGGLRLIPSINKMMAGVLQIKTNQFVQHELMEHLSLIDLQHHLHPAVLPIDEPLHVKNVTFQYPGRNVLMHDVNLRIEPGEKVALVGVSGAGKSSFLMLLLGFLKPTAGSFEMNEINSHYQKWKSLFAFVPQNPILFPGSIASNICLHNSEDDASLQRAERALHQVGLWNWVNELPQGIHTSIGPNGIQISGGQRQRLAMARALFMERSIIVMDEPTAQLDAHAAEQLIQLVTQLPITVILATHQLHLLTRFDVVYEIKNKTVSIVQ